jgi:cation-transporting ATPase 13A3/4/5
MVTGDNTLTGIRVAHEAGILSPDMTIIVGSVREGAVLWTNENGDEVDMPSEEQLDTNQTQLALSGAAWHALRENDLKLAHYIAPFVRVFGRCTPYDKVSVVDTFVELGFVTLMAGDGGNDVGALKAAHVGVALSDAEASIVSPFTSLDRSISSVVEILQEGRCALASAFAVYKYISKLLLPGKECFRSINVCPTNRHHNALFSLLLRISHVWTDHDAQPGD